MTNSPPPSAAVGTVPSPADLLAAIVEGSNDVIMAKRLDGVIISWNPAAERLFGYSEADALGQRVGMLIPADHQGEDDVVMQRIVEGGRVQHYETERLTRDGRRVPVSLTVSAVRDESGSVIGASKIIRDITEQKRLAEHARQAEELAAANEQLAAADQLKDQFLAMANHEMRTPLTAIGGFTRTMLDLEDRFGPAERRAFLEIISEQTDRLTRMVDDMLLLSRIELGTFAVQPEDIEVTRVARRALRGVRRGDVVVHGDDALLARVDPHHFEQMLLNYVDNAHKYGAGVIDVDIRLGADRAVEVRVRDEGAGVSHEFEARLFDRFTRSDEHASSPARGAGLGLSIVRGLARAQGGEAWYEPREPRGSQFCLRLPPVVDPVSS